MADMHNFIAIMEQRRPSVIHLANSAHSAVVEKYHLVLKSILECVESKIYHSEDIEMMTHILALETRETSKLF